MEKAKEIEGKKGVLRGIVHNPHPKQNGIAIIPHGYFSSNKIGPSRLYVQISRELAKLGYRVWRFDCYGVGDSDGIFREVSYYSELEDYQTILQTAFEYEPSNNILLVGHSMGTSLSVRLANLGSRVRKLLIISPSFGRITWIENLLDPKQISELNNKGSTIRNGLFIKSSFVENMQSKNVFDVCQKIGVSTRVVYGASDQFYSLESVKRATYALRAEEFHLIPEADHNFIIGNSRSRLLDLIKTNIKNW